MTRLSLALVLMFALAGSVGASEDGDATLADAAGARRRRAGSNLIER